MFRTILRGALATWGRTNLVPGYHYVAVERYGPALAGPGRLETTLPNGCRIDCDLHDHVQRHQWFFGAYEPIDSYLFTRLLRPGMTVVDAGANVGQYTILAATAVAPTGTVHAFEPVPENFERLSEAVRRNNLTNVRLNRAGLWHEATTLHLGRPADEKDNAGSFSVVADGDRGQAIEAPGVRLDDYLEAADIGHVDLIKMDIEGAEPFALQGALTMLQRDRPTLLMEVNRESLAGMGSDPAALASLLQPLGYRAWKIGISTSESGPADLSGLDRANVILHQDGLPPEVTGGWDLRSALSWARGRW